ncbi:MAG: hypothetical protein Q4C73_04275 [Eubacteriales bacterium]|nr:hypothetical protein [Eubacteriales bacterium]
MGERMWKGRWRRLDNTAKIFPVIANEQMSQVFRLSVTLKETVDPELLQQAVERILPSVRNFRVKLRRGLFWYYFEENTRIPQVQRENTYPCRYLDPHGSQKFLFRISYYEKRINLEMFHALTDGLGAVNFLKRLTKQYLQLKNGAWTEYWTAEDEKTAGDMVFHTEDSYLANYREMEPRSYSSRPAYRLEGDYLPLGTAQVLHGYISVSSLKQLCRRHEVSITKYLAAALIWSIWKEYRDGGICRLPIVLNLPINLRAIFGSDTMSNFFAVTMIGYLFRNPELSFETLLSAVSRQMDKRIDKKRLEESISYNVSNEKKWYLRSIPLFIKAPVLRMIFRMKDRAYTMTLSNIGPISMEPEYEKDIERFHLMIGVSRSQPVKCAVCAWKDEMVITFTSVFADSRLQRRFFGKLKEDGIFVRLEGNDLCGAKKRDMYPRIRRILVLRRGGEEKAARLAKQVGHTGGSAAKGLFAYVSGRKNLKEECRRRLHI